MPDTERPHASQSTIYAKGWRGVDEFHIKCGKIIE